MFVWNPLSSLLCIRMVELVFSCLVRRRLHLILERGLPLGSPHPKLKVQPSALLVALFLALFLHFWGMMSGHLILALAMGIPGWNPQGLVLIQGAAP